MTDWPTRYHRWRRWIKRVDWKADALRLATESSALKARIVYLEAQHVANTQVRANMAHEVRRLREQLGLPLAIVFRDLPT